MCGIDLWWRSYCNFIIKTIRTNLMLLLILEAFLNTPINLINLDHALSFDVVTGFFEARLLPRVGGVRHLTGLRYSLRLAEPILKSNWCV
jgi:hypothetical protein